MGCGGECFFLTLTEFHQFLFHGVAVGSLKGVSNDHVFFNGAGNQDIDNGCGGVPPAWPMLHYITYFLFQVQNNGVSLGSLGGIMDDHIVFSGAGQSCQQWLWWRASCLALAASQQCLFQVLQIALVLDLLRKVLDDFWSFKSAGELSWLVTLNWTTLQYITLVQLLQMALTDSWGCFERSWSLSEVGELGYWQGLWW